MTQSGNESRLFHYFEEISRVPRCSGNRAGIARWLEDFAVSQGLDYKRDEADNVLIFKPGSGGKENAPPIALQGHTDMVCEKAPDSDHNFETDPIELIREGDILRANKTTLGGDNGIAVAMILALLEDKELAHPPLEAVFTSDEETSLIGAHALAPDAFSAKRLINIDSEAEGILWTGCAGGETIEMTLPITRTGVENLQAAELYVEGLTGGHSGLEIHRKRHNAIKVLTEVLNRLKDEIPIGLDRIQGGTKHNAIPREAYARLVFSAEDKDAVMDYTKKIADELVEVYAQKGYEDQPLIRIEEAALPERAFSLESFENVLACLTLLPSGVYSMSPHIEGLVQTSNNLAVVSSDDTEVQIITSIRSSAAEDTDKLRGKIISTAEIAGAKVETSGGYPAWEVKEESALRDTFARVFETMYGKKPEITAVHAGLETALFADRDPEMDLVSLGPDMYEVHTPQEHLSIGSAQRVYDLLRAVLQEL